MKYHDRDLTADIPGVEGGGGQLGEAVEIKSSFQGHPYGGVSLYVCLYKYTYTYMCMYLL